MKICFDTNVILDVLLERDPWYPAAVTLMSKAETKIIDAYICPTTVTTIAYLIQKHSNKKMAKELIEHLLRIFNLTEINKHVCQAALDINFSDYEDAVLHESAKFSGIDAILTRNTKDFKSASLGIYTPEELIAIL